MNGFCFPTSIKPGQNGCIVPKVTAALVLVLFFACGENPQKQASTAGRPSAALATSSGPIPEAARRFAGPLPQGAGGTQDGVGLQVQLQLAEDGRYLWSEQPSGNRQIQNKSEGFFAFRGDTLLLDPQENQPRRFLMQEQALLWLDHQAAIRSDGDGRPYRLEEQDHLLAKPAPPMIDNNSHSSDLARKKWAEGIRAYALGQEPFWALDFHPTKGWTFRTPEGLQAQGPPRPLEPGPNGSWVLEFSMTAGGTGEAPDQPSTPQSLDWLKNVHIRFTAQACSDPMSGTPYPYAVELRGVPGSRLDSVVYHGCGRFPMDPAWLGTWMLDAHNGVVLDPADYPRGLPTMQLDETRVAVFGSDGCNRFNGRMRHSPGGVVVDQAMMSTKMACPGNGYTLAADLAGKRWSIWRSGAYLEMEAVQQAARSEGQTLRFQSAQD